MAPPFAVKNSEEKKVQGVNDADLCEGFEKRMVDNKWEWG